MRSGKMARCDVWRSQCSSSQGRAAPLTAAHMGLVRSSRLQTQRQEDRRRSAGLTRGRPVWSVISLTRFTRAWQHCREDSDLGKPTAPHETGLTGLEEKRTQALAPLLVYPPQI